MPETVHLPSQARAPAEVRIAGDCVVAGDLHAQAVDWDLVSAACDFGRRFGIRKAALVGDIVNFDAFSQYPQLVHSPPVAEEIAAAGAAVGRFLARFDLVYLCRGNHDARLTYRTDGQITMDMIADLMVKGEPRRRLIVTCRDRLWLKSGGALWLLCHQKQYSRVKLRVANDLAQKYHCNVVTHHQHAIAVGLSQCGRYVIADNGAMCDPARLPYKEMNTTTFPAWNAGFAVIRDGIYMPYVHQRAMGIK